MSEPNAGMVLKYWPIISVIVAGLIAGAVGLDRLDAHGQSLGVTNGKVESNSKAIVGLKDKVVEEGTATQLAIQKLELVQKSAASEAHQRDIAQQRTLDAILQAVKP